MGDYFQSFDKFLKDACPNSWSYVREALRAVKELKDVPFEDLLQMKRCNIQQLKQTSSSVRVLPDVIEAAKTLPEKELVAKLNSDHEQHLECKVPVVMATEDEVAEFNTAIAVATIVEGCATRSEAIRAISVSYLQEHPVEAGDVDAGELNESH